MAPTPVLSAAEGPLDGAEVEDKGVSVAGHTWRPEAHQSGEDNGVDEDLGHGNNDVPENAHP